MATYDVKYKAKGWDGSKSNQGSKKVRASSWSEAKTKVKSDVEKARTKLSKNYSDADPKPRVSYKGSTATLTAKSSKTGIVKKVTTVKAQTGQPIVSRNFNKTFTTKGGGGGGIYDMTRPLRNATRRGKPDEKLF